MGMRGRGFTLIELLVVIGIIAVLAAILFPVFGRAREQGRIASCISNQRQIAQAITIYTQDYDETYPPEDAVWELLSLEPGLLRCPTRRKGLGNGYVYNYFLANEPLSIVTHPDLFMLTADGHTGSDDAALNVYFTGGNVDRRHAGGYVASYADGHAERQRGLPGGLLGDYYYAKTPPGTPTLGSPFDPTQHHFRFVTLRVDPQLNWVGDEDTRIPYPRIPGVPWDVGAYGEAGTGEAVVIWTGWIMPPRTGDYTFTTISDDGCRVWVGDIAENPDPLIDNGWSVLYQPNTEARNPTPLPLTIRQKVPIRVEYRNTQWTGQFSLEWECTGLNRQIIPVEWMYPN